MLPKKPKPVADWYQYNLLQTIHANQLVMIGMLKTILTKETKMAVDLTALTAEVARNTTVEASVEALVAQLVALVKAIPPSTDPTTQAALDALAKTLTDNDAALAAAVAANTPAA